MRICLFIFMASCLAQGSDRALLIGVTDCLNDTWPALPGINKDIDMMRDVCKRLGIDEVHVLTGRDATKLNILNSVERWLIQAVKPGDRALLYFSGHGYFLPDNDGDETRDERHQLFDEILIPADTIWRDKPVANFIRDDDVFTLLRRIPTQNTWLIVDACHSGTVYRGLGQTDGWVAKNLVGKKPKPITRSIETDYRGFDVEEKNLARFISFAAAEDHEKAIATPQGSLFTRGIHNTVMATSGRRLTFQELSDKTKGFIVKLSGKRSSQTPVLAGDQNSFNKNIFQPATHSKNQWSQLEWRADEAGYALNITSNGNTFEIGQDLQLFVKNVPNDGYLNILSVDSRDEVTILYPNYWENQNQVWAGESIQIPAQNATYRIPAVEPIGRTMILAIHTQQPLNLYLDPHESASSFFRQIEGDGVSKALRMLTDEPLEKTRKGYGAAELIVHIR